MLATDYYLQSVDVRQFVEKARLLIFQLYCRIHSRVKLECVSCVTVGDGRQLAFLPPPPTHPANTQGSSCHTVRFGALLHDPWSSHPLPHRFECSLVQGCGLHAEQGCRCG